MNSIQALVGSEAAPWSARHPHIQCERLLASTLTWRPAYSQANASTCPTWIRIICSTGTRRWRFFCGLRLQPPGDDHWLPWHRQVELYIEQTAARLNWPCVRINLDSHVSRIDLVACKDAIVLKDSKQVTEFRDGMFRLGRSRTNIALCFPDEYDAGRPDVMFVIQRVLEISGSPDPARSAPRHSARTRGSACSRPPTRSGLGTHPASIHGTQQINQGQMDRWSIVATLNYLHRTIRRSTSCSPSRACAPGARKDGRDTVNKMVHGVADLTRNAFVNGDLSTAVMSPRAPSSPGRKTRKSSRTSASLSA